MSNSLQQAFALSKQDYRSSNQAKEILKLTKSGKFVLGVTCLIHCRFTDAVIAEEESIYEIHDTLDTAQARFDELQDDYCGEMFLACPPPPPPIPMFVPKDQDAPF